MAMTKTELIQIVLDKSKMKRMEATKFVEDFFEVIIKSLSNGEVVKLPGFGNFTLRDKAQRNGRNPRTGDEFLIDARRVVSFRTSNMLKSAIKDQCNKGK